MAAGPTAATLDDEDDSLDSRRAAGGERVSGPVDVHRLQAASARARCATTPARWKTRVTPAKAGGEGVGDGHVSAHDLGAEAVEPGRAGVRSRQRADLAILRAKGADELDAEIAGRAGDEGDHRGGPSRPAPTGAGLSFRAAPP